MSSLQEKREIVARFKVFNQNLCQIFNINSIEKWLEPDRYHVVDYQIRELFSILCMDIIENKTYDQISVELSNSLTSINDLIIQLENKESNASTINAIKKGLKYIHNEIKNLNSVYDEKLRSSKAKSKCKFGDVVISEKEYALFIILAKKYGLISKVPVAGDIAIAFSALTNISDQSLRDNIGGKYQINPSELLLKPDNLTVLMETLINICDEIEIIKESLTN